MTDLDRPPDDDPRGDYDDEFGRDWTPEGMIRRRVRGPALALAIIGWLGITVGLVGLVLGIAVLTGIIPTRHATDEMVGGLLTVFAIIGLAVSTVIALGGHRMMQCRSIGLARLGAVFCIGTFFLLSIYSLFLIPFGIWALVVLAREDVKTEFDRVRRAAGG